MKTIILLLMLSSSAAANIDLSFKREESIHSIPSNLLKAICFVESGLDAKLINKFDAYSDSFGMCQVKLTAARHVGYVHSPKLLSQHDINIRIAAKYFRYQLDRYNGNINKALTAYNRGSINNKTNLDNSYVRKVYKAWKMM